MHHTAFARLLFSYFLFLENIPALLGLEARWLCHLLTPLALNQVR